MGLAQFGVCKPLTSSNPMFGVKRLSLDRELIHGCRVWRPTLSWLLTSRTQNAWSRRTKWGIRTAARNGSTPFPTSATRASTSRKRADRAEPELTSAASGQSEYFDMTTSAAANLAAERRDPCPARSSRCVHDGGWAWRWWRLRRPRESRKSERASRLNRILHRSAYSLAAS